MTDRTRTTILAVLGGLIAGSVLFLVIVLFTSDDGDGVAVSTSIPPVTTTIAAPSSTSNVSTTTTVVQTTTSSSSTTTTTVTPLGWGTATQQNTTLDGSPGPYLTDVRVGDHATFTRVVFDFTGDGTPMWIVGYETGPSFSGSGGGTSVTPDGSAFLTVHVSPGLTQHVDTFAPVYTGPTSLTPGLGPIAEVVFVDDFEADMLWVIGLDGVKGFQVDTLTGPVRLVIDIEH